MKETSFLLRQVSGFFVSPTYERKHFQQMLVGQTASIPVSLFSNPTSTLTTIWCAFLIIFSPHPILHIQGGFFYWSALKKNHSVYLYLLQVELATSTGSFDGGDQGLLNTHFSSWATQVKTNCPFNRFLHVWYLGYFEAPSLRVQHGRLCLLLLPTRLQEVRRQREDRSLHWSRQAVDGRGRGAFTCVRIQEILVAALLLSGSSISTTNKRIRTTSVVRWLPGYRWQERDLVQLSTNRFPRRHLKTQGENF